MPVGLILYVATALLLGIVYGHTRRVGILGVFLLSLLLTPPLFFLILILTAPKKPVITVPQNKVVS